MGADDSLPPRSCSALGFLDARITNQISALPAHDASPVDWRYNPQRMTVRLRLEFADPIPGTADPTYVTLFDSMRPPNFAVATGTGDGRDNALLDLWNTLMQRDEAPDLIERTAEAYRRLTGVLPPSAP